MPPVKTNIGKAYAMIDIKKKDILGRDRGNKEKAIHLK